MSFILHIGILVFVVVIFTVVVAILVLGLYYCYKTTFNNKNIYISIIDCTSFCLLLSNIQRIC